VVKVEPHCVERTPHVEPIGRSDDPLIAKTEHLASGDEIDPAFVRPAQLYVRLPEVPDILVGWRRWHVVIEEDARILCHPNDLQPVGRLNIRLCARIRKAGEMAATLRMALDLEVA
jgi:hypothetical protein